MKLPEFVISPVIIELCETYTKETINWEKYYSQGYLEAIELIFAEAIPTKYYQNLEENNYSLFFSFLAKFSQIFKDVDLNVVFYCISYIILKLNKLNYNFFAYSTNKIDSSWIYSKLDLITNNGQKYLLLLYLVLTDPFYASTKLSFLFLDFLSLSNAPKDYIILTNIIQISLCNSFYKNAYDQVIISSLLKFCIDKNISSQCAYQTLSIIWIASFKKFSHDQIVKDLLFSLTNILKVGTKEKVCRLAIFILRYGKNLVLPIIIAQNIRTLISGFKETFHDDFEILDDLDFCLNSIDDYLLNSSTFEQYKLEIFSHVLVWSPFHTSNIFWKLNFAKFTENDSEILKHLQKILSSEDLTETKKIAANDICYFLEFHPSGKQFADKLNFKETMLNLLHHPDSEVRFYSLSAIQKLMAV